MTADNPILDVEQGNSDQRTEAVETTSSSPASTESSGFSWKSNLGGDLSKAPGFDKYPDTVEGLNNLAKANVNLEKLLGHDKVPIPKDANDVEGWNRFSKALGIPDKAEGYGLADATIPDSMKGITFDKNKFAETVHAFKLTPSQAKGLWKAYTEQSVEAYNKALSDHKTNMDKVVNTLKSEWGDAYDTNIELGQMVINKFASDQETNDYLTSVLSKDPKAIKFLAKIGEQFSENKIGEFGYKKFSLSPEQAENEIQSILRDPKHPYNNDRATPQEHDAAIAYVNNLYLTKNRGRG